MTMTYEQKIEWLKNATNEKLLRVYLSLNNCNEFGVNDEDIKLTKAEILKRINNKVP